LQHFLLEDVKNPNVRQPICYPVSSSTTIKRDGTKDRKQDKKSEFHSIAAVEAASFAAREYPEIGRAGRGSQGATACCRLGETDNRKRKRIKRKESTEYTDSVKRHGRGFRRQVREPLPRPLKIPHLIRQTQPN